jgi:hypothetical protein
MLKPGLPKLMKLAALYTLMRDTIVCLDGLDTDPEIPEEAQAAALYVIEWAEKSLPSIMEAHHEEIDRIRDERMDRRSTEKSAPFFNFGETLRNIGLDPDTLPG